MATLPSTHLPSLRKSATSPRSFPWSPNLIANILCGSHAQPDGTTLSSICLVLQRKKKDQWTRLWSTLRTPHEDVVCLPGLPCSSPQHKFISPLFIYFSAIFDSTPPVLPCPAPRPPTPTLKRPHPSKLRPVLSCFHVTVGPQPIIAAESQVTRPATRNLFSAPSQFCHHLQPAF